MEMVYERQLHGILMPVCYILFQYNDVSHSVSHEIKIAFGANNLGMSMCGDIFCVQWTGDGNFHTMASFQA